jgi:hypothetical protein
MRISSTTGWFLRAAATASVILMACWVAPRWLKSIPEFPPVTTDEQRFGLLKRFVQEPIPDTVLLGSSLTFLLKENYFEPGTVRNLGLAGHSSLTGLAVLAAEQDLQPHVVAVETNILFRPIDQSLVDLSGRLREEQRWLPPIRTLAAYYQDLSETKKQVMNLEQTRAALAAPPGSPDGNQRIAQTLMEWDTTALDNAVAAQLPVMKALVTQLEARGATVLFFELPLAPVVARFHYPEMARKAFRDSFGHDDARWLALDYPADQIRWGDGIHLDERSALLLSISLEKAIAGKLAAMRERRPRH